ncbi:MAG: PorT family protein [Prevotellaceae bacterium]|jgi:hypothetical protein|nr:PorT family protein [Prevotellaceae bacterium]
MASPKKTLLTSILLTCVNVYAQHEFHIEAGGGLSTLNYDVLFGDQKNGIAEEFGVGYSFFFSPNFGIRSGANLSYYHAKATLSNLFDSYDAYDGEEYFEFRYKINHYEEKQHALYLNIPLMVQFQYGKKQMLYVAAGGKLGIPLLGKYKTTSNSFKTSGYYPSINIEFEEPEFMGFGTFSDKHYKDDFDLHIIGMLSLEAGVKWQLSDKFYLYTGAYFDYGLNNVVKNNFNKALVKYNIDRPDCFRLNGIPTSNYTDR